MKTKQHTVKTLMISCSIMMLAASLLTVNGWAQTAETEGSAEAEVSALIDGLAQAVETQAAETGSSPEASEADISAAQQALESANQQRRAFREARRQATLERVHSEKEAKKESVQATAALTDINVSFKLDPRLTRGSDTGDGSNMGDAWVSPPIGSSAQEGEFTLEARVQGRDAKGQAMDISPLWIAADPSMVEVAPAEGHAVKITVRGSGESNLTVAVPGLSKDLWISATNQGKAIRVQIFQ